MTRLLFPIALASILLCPLAARADSSPSDVDDLAELRRRLVELEADREANRETIDALRDEVDGLRAENDDNWLTERRTEEIRGLVQDVLADADTRTSLQGSDMTSGYGKKGFYIASSDGNFRLNISATIQVQYAYNHQRNPSAADPDSSRSGFENRRTALRLGGHVIDPTWKYFVQGNFSPANGGFVLLDALIEKDFENGWSVKGGKFKLPFSREQLMSFNNLGLVERSLIANAFGVGRSQGIAASWRNEQFRVSGAFSDGLGTIVGTTALSVAMDTEYAFSGRGEWLVWGDFKEFGDFTAWEDQDGLLIGIAGHWQDGEYGTTAPSTQILRWTADASWKLHPFNVFASVYGNHTTGHGDPAAGQPGSVDQYGVVVQAGWLLPCKWEIIGRYEWANSGDAGTPASDLNIATIGVARYFKGQKLKWTTDLGYAFQPVSTTFAAPPKAWRTDSDNGQFVVRSQFQLVF